MGTEKQVELSSNGVQNNNVVKKKIVYNMYRDMLKTYNGRANEILETKPTNCVVTEDRGIGDRVESMARQIPMSGPPPPPPLSLGAVPAVRLKSEISEHRPEPPACVQNAMMTKDKKPFTYTPGGLDLSQIKSPRMAKRVSRNAAAEGVGAVPQSPQPVPQQVQQQMMPPMPQGPGGMPPPPPPPPGVGVPMVPPPPPSVKPPPPSNNLPPFTRPDIKIPENPMNLLRKTGGPHRPPGPIIGPDEVLTKQPTMGDQNQQRQPPIQAPLQTPPQAVQSPVQPVPQPIYRPVKPPQPVYQPMSPQPQVYQPPPPQPQVYQPPPPQPQVYQAPPTPVQVQTQADHRPETRTQVGTLYIPPLSPEELQQKNPPLRSGSDSPGSPLDTLKKAPTPWLTNRVQQRQQEVPSWARSPAESTASSTPSTPATPGTPAVSTPATTTPSGGTRVIPVKIEFKDDAMQQMQQQQQQFLQQQQQQFQQQQQQFLQQQQQQFRQHQQDQFRQQQFHQQQTQQQQHVVRVIPIQIEGRSNSGPLSPTNNVSSPELLECGPVQSPTFRILQRVTSRDEEIHAQPAVAHPAAAAQPFSPPATPVDQMRRLQFSEEDKSLMNRVRNQVDGDVFLHTEEDPRYRGPAIPSRAFRMLQCMTDAAEASGDPTCVPKPVLVTRGPPGIKMNQPGTPTGENVPASEQRAPEPRKYTGSAIPSRSFQMLQAMVAPENCANGTETDENVRYPYDPNYYPYYDPMYPYYDPYWAYYQNPNAYTQETETPSSENSTEQNASESNGTPTMSEEEYYAQMPYWDPYYAYYYYGYYPPAPHPYSPHAFYPSNETDDYSSTDEMSYYGARFPRGPTPCGHVSAPLSEQVTPTDTEVEEINDKEETQSDLKSPGLQAIRSVSDIQVYDNSTEEQSVTEEEEEEEDETDTSESGDESESTEDGEEPKGHLPHQLSVIFEESEMSEIERRKREASVATTISEDDSSTTIGGEQEQTDESCDEDLGETSVTVRLPLKLKFGRSENGKEEVTEVIVGDSEMEPNTPENSISVSYTMKSPITVNGRTSVRRQNSEETVENYETAEDSDENSRNNSPVEVQGDDDTDFWDEINKTVKSDQEQDEDADVSDEEIITQVETTATTTNKIPDTKQDQDSQVTQNENEEEEDGDDDDEEDSSSDSEDETDDCKLEKDLRDAFASDAVKEQVRKLREAGKLSLGADIKEESVSVRQRIMAIENGCTNGTASASRSSSAKGGDFSEEDGDSGVTSDVSRHTDTESEICDKLKNRYERAATHSRLFKLLQDECAKSDDEDDEEEMESDDRRKQLSLPLSGSEPESGICSPASPTWLARELIHGLLGGRQGRKYRSLPIERLYAAAQRILQEDVLSNTSEDGSPLDSYASEYKSYYNSWEDASMIKKRVARCPRVKSEKNLPAKVTEEKEDDNKDVDPDSIISSPNEPEHPPGRLMARS